MRSFRFSLAVFVVLIIFHSSASALRIRKAVELPADKLFSSEGVTCGLPNLKWIPGRILKNGKFLSHSAKIKQLKKKARRSEENVAARIFRKIRKLRKRLRREKPTCVSGPSTDPTAQPSADPSGTATPQPTAAPESFAVAASAFNEGDPIPEKYTNDGVNVSPPLSWSNPPDGTQSFVVIMDDPDAPGGTWTHWIVYDIPAGVSSLAEDAGANGDGGLPSGAKHGTNSWYDNALGAGNYYAGPAPPSGTHRYVFKVYALNQANLNVGSQVSISDIETAMAGNILDQVEVMGTYTKK